MSNYMPAKITVQLEKYVMVPKEDLMSNCFYPLDYIEGEEIACSTTLHILTDEEISVLAQDVIDDLMEMKEVWDEMRAEEFGLNEDMGFDPYLGCYTDDC